MRFASDGVEKNMLSVMLLSGTGSAYTVFEIKGSNSGHKVLEKLQQLISHSQFYNLVTLTIILILR